MARKVLILSLGLLLISSLSLYGAKKPAKVLPQEKIKPADESIVYPYVTTPEPKMYFPATGDTAGFTYYDYQHNNSQKRQVAYDPVNGLAHVDWMNLVGPDMVNNRFIDYNNMDLLSGLWLAAGGVHVTPAVGRGGYCVLDVLPDGREVLGFHLVGGTYVYRSALAIEKTIPGLGDFRLYDPPDSAPSPFAGQYGGMIWPNIACAKEAGKHGDTTFIHIVNFSDGADDMAGYVRCFEDPVAPETLMCQSPVSGWTAPIKVKPNTKLVPNRVIANFEPDGKVTYIAAAVATSPVSKKVAIAWHDDVDAWYKGEIYYVESTNNGNDWMAAQSIPAPTKVTNYQAENWEKYTTYYTEITAVYDYNNELHIFWTASPAGGEGEAVTTFHWSPSTGIRIVGSKLVTKDTGAWSHAMAKLTAGVQHNPGHPYYNYLYLLYTGFSDDDVSAAEFANGDLYMKVSSNGGNTWGPENNITNTKTNGCLAGDCLSEHWGSVAEVVGDSIFAAYIEDKDAGGIPQDEGTFTYNAVRLWADTAYGVPAVPSISYAPMIMTSPVRWATNGGSTSEDMVFDNVGTATLYVKVTDPAPSYTTITNGVFNIIEAGPTQTVGITFNGAGLQDTFIIDSLKIESNNGVVGGGEVYSDVRWVRYHFVVTNNYYYAEFDTCPYSPITTVSNIGNLGNQEVPENGMFYNGKSYLFEFTPVFVTNDINGSGPVGFTWLHDHNDFLAESTLAETVYPNLGVAVFYDKLAPIFPSRRSDYSTYRSWWGYWTKYSKVIQLHPQAILVENWWKWNAPPVWWDDLTGPTNPQPGYFGIAADWDVISYVSSKNKGGYDETNKLIWLYADTLGFTDFYGGFLWLDASVDGTHETGPFGAHVLTNRTQLYPFGGYNDDSLLKYMSTPGYSIENDSAQDMNIVMSFAEVLSPTPSTEIYMKYALLVTDIGKTAFKGSSIQAKNLNDLAKLIKQLKAGDANADGSVSVSDVVYLINFLFKGGAPPWKAVSDPNCDNSISVSDVVYLINFLFKGGPAPCLIWD